MLPILLIHITIMIVTRNRPLYLNRTIHNACQSTIYNSNYNVEIIIIDDSDPHLLIPIPTSSCTNIVHHHILPTKTSTGQKRNIAASLANGKCIIHWDDDDIYDLHHRLKNQCNPILNHEANLTALEYNGWITPTDCYITDLSGLDKCEPHWGTLAWSKSLYPKYATFSDSYTNEDLSFVHQAMSINNTTLIIVSNQYFVATRHESNSWKFNTNNYIRLNKIPCQILIHDMVDYKVYSGLAKNIEIPETETPIDIEITTSSSLNEIEAKEITVRKNIDWGMHYRPTRTATTHCTMTTHNTHLNHNATIVWQRTNSDAEFLPMSNFLMFGKINEMVVLCGGYSARGLNDDCWSSIDQGISWQHQIAPWNRNIGMSAITSTTHGTVVTDGCKSSDIFYNRGKNLLYLSPKLWKKYSEPHRNSNLPKLLFPILIEHPTSKNILLQLGGHSCHDDTTFAPSSLIVSRSLIDLSFQDMWEVDVFQTNRIVAGTTFGNAVIAICINEVENKNVVFESTNGGKAWIQISSIDQGSSMSPTTNFGLISTSSFLFMIGGSNQGSASKVILQSVDGGKNWHALKQLAQWKGRWSFGILNNNEEIMVVGGFAGWKVKYNDVWRGSLE